MVWAGGACEIDASYEAKKLRNLLEELRKLRDAQKLRHTPKACNVSIQEGVRFPETPIYLKLQEDPI